MEILKEINDGRLPEKRNNNNDGLKSFLENNATNQRNNTKNILRAIVGIVVNTSLYTK